jgi:hypothetical protein
MSGKTPLNEEEIKDVEEIEIRYPDISTSCDAFLSILLSSAPYITQNGKPPSKTLAFLTQEYYVPFCYEHFKWFKRIGLHPYYFERWVDRDSPESDVHYVPRTPVWRSGTINTYLDNKARQQFEWIPATDTQRKRMYFFRCPNHTPLLSGKLCSSLASVIHDWKTKKIVRECTELVSQQQAHPQHIFEYHPRKEMDATKFTQSFQFAEKQTGEAAYRDTVDGIKTLPVRNDAMMAAIQHTNNVNMGWKRRLGTSNVINSEGMDEIWERENAGILARGIPLFEHFVYKPVPAPTLTANYEYLCRRLDTQVAAIMDFPIQSIDSKSSKNTTATLAGNMRYINDRVNSWRFVFEQMIAFVFKTIYEMDCEVEIITTPIARLEDLRILYEDQLWSKEEYADHAFKILGIHRKK